MSCCVQVQGAGVHAAGRGASAASKKLSDGSECAGEATAAAA